MVSQKLLSPAKINLMLRILGQRSDGYHQLQTLFQILDWGDEMQFNECHDIGNNQIKITGFSDLPVENNLIYKAAQLISRFARNNSSWLIEVDKHIPEGGGLGGGSSNAATTLRFLNDHWQCGLNQQELMKLGGELGADVPIFVLNTAALATGVGEQLKPMSFETPYVLLLFPEVSIATAELFSHCDLLRSQQHLPIQYIQNSNFWINDFFPLLLKTNHQIAELYDRIKPFARFRLSGTGSTMFALFDSFEEADVVAQSVKKYVNFKVVQSKTDKWSAALS